ncbi:transketolase family protein [Harryflintia acetispora]|uniref:Transketolase subunit B n=1 Tax=Harryflintia acetispora TaxID=1849041 RepID=A0A9X8Y7X2_9FIRM|nr:transketolase C-terminal domain-containing protein [Harryflintia acetispora]TCL43007.1 transketolase subunit B [Harryflintia acetispora]
MRNRFIKGLEQLAETDSGIFLLTGDLGFSVLDAFAERFPERFINAGISEQNMMSVAAGLALNGNTVYVYSIGNFVTLRCLEQIRNDVCYHSANVKIVVVGGGFAYGQLGMSHHATEDIAVMRALPNMRVYCPADPVEAVAVLHEVNSVEGPCYVRLAKGGEQCIHADAIADINKAIQLKAGDCVNIFTTGTIVSEARLAAKQLADHGVSGGVYSFPAIKPIDTELICQCAWESKLIVTLEEHNRLGGLGGAVAEVISELSAPHARLLRLGLDDEYTSVVGSQQYLRTYYGLNAEKITKRILECWEN